MPKLTVKTIPDWYRHWHPRSKRKRSVIHFFYKGKPVCNGTIELDGLVVDSLFNSTRKKCKTCKRVLDSYRFKFKIPDSDISNTGE